MHFVKELTRKNQGLRLNISVILSQIKDGFMVLSGGGEVGFTSDKKNEYEKYHDTVPLKMQSV
jgi:hypothetical protein